MNAQFPLYIRSSDSTKQLQLGMKLMLSPAVLFLVVSLSAASGTKTDPGCSQPGDKMPPHLTFLRRVPYRNNKGALTRITIIYKTSEKVKVTWFRKASRNLPDSDIPNMLQVAPLSGYRTSALACFNVYGTTLIIDPKKASMSSEIEFVTSFEIQGTTIAYSLRTQAHKLPSKWETLNGTRWEKVPRDLIFFRLNDPFCYTCNALIESDSKEGSPELSLTHGHFVKNDTKMLESFNTVFNLNVGNANGYNDQRTKITSDIITDKSNTSHYKTTLQVLNADHKSGGFIVCKLQREEETMYVTTVAQQGTPLNTPVDERLRWVVPKVGLVSCENNNVNKSGDVRVVQLTKGQDSCIRCLGYGYPQVQMSVKKRKSNTVLQPTKTIRVRRHINVAKGGVPEVVVTFLNASGREHDDQYQCVAYSRIQKKVERINFDIVVRS